MQQRLRSNHESCRTCVRSEQGLAAIGCLPNAWSVQILRLRSMIGISSACRLTTVTRRCLADLCGFQSARSAVRATLTPFAFQIGMGLARAAAAHSSCAFTAAASWRPAPALRPAHHARPVPCGAARFRLQMAFVGGVVLPARLLGVVEQRPDGDALAGFLWISRHRGASMAR